MKYFLCALTLAFFSSSVFGTVVANGCKINADTLKESLEHSIRIVRDPQGRQRVESQPCNRAFRIEFFIAPYSLAKHTNDEFLGVDEEGLDQTDQYVNYLVYLPSVKINIPIMNEGDAKKFDDSNIGWTGPTLPLSVDIKGIFSGAPRLMAAHKAYKRLLVVGRTNAAIQFELYISLPDRVYNDPQSLKDALDNTFRRVRINSVGGISVTE